MRKGVEIAEKKRKPFYNASYRVFKSAYESMLHDVSEQIELGLSLVTNPTEEAYQRIFDSAANNMPKKYIDNAFLATYLRTGVWFANDQYESIFSQKSFVKKQIAELDEEWVSYFNQLIRSAEITELISSSYLSTVKRLKDIAKPIIIETLAKGYSIRKASQEILRQVGKEWNRTNRFNAARIARTEVLTASNAGSIQGALSTGLEMEKFWIDTRDNRERSTHLTAGKDERNQKTPIKGNFHVAGELAQFPGDLKLSARERIQCRCTQGFRVVG